MHASHEVTASEGTHRMNGHPYRGLLIMAALSLVSMYLLMYAMVNVIGNVYLSLNQFYMAALMTSPMIVMELVLMGAMYRNKKWNALIMTASVAGMMRPARPRQPVACGVDCAHRGRPGSGPGFPGGPQPDLRGPAPRHPRERVLAEAGRR